MLHLKCIDSKPGHCTTRAAFDACPGAHIILIRNPPFCVRMTRVARVEIVVAIGCIVGICSCVLGILMVFAPESLRDPYEHSQWEPLASRIRCRTNSEIREPARRFLA